MDEQNVNVIPSKVPITPETVKGVSPGEAAKAVQTAMNGNAFDVFDRGLVDGSGGKGEAGVAQSASSAVSTSPVATPPPVQEPVKESVSTPAPVTPFDPDKLPPDFRPKAEHWKTVNAERTRLREELAATKKQIEELGDFNTLKNLAAEKAELEKQLRMVAADRDPEFQRQYNESRKSLMDDAISAVPPEHADHVRSIIERHGAGAVPYLREFIRQNELDGFSQSQLAAAVAGLRTLEANRERTIQASAENWNKLVTEQRLTSQREVERVRKQQEAMLEERLQLAGKEHPLFQATSEEEKPEVEEAIAVARRVSIGDLDPEERVNVALSTAAFPRLIKAYAKLVEQNKKLTEQLSGLRAVQPGGGGASGGVSNGDDGIDFKQGGRGRDAGDIFLKNMRAAGL